MILSVYLSWLSILAVADFFVYTYLAYRYHISLEDKRNIVRISFH